MELPESLLEYLHRKKVKVGFQVNNTEDGMKAYVLIFPVEKEEEQKYKNNLLPVVSYEIRYIKHKEIYTDSEWGLDYDHVLEDKSTRIKRVFVDRNEENSELFSVLSEFDIDFLDFKRLRFFDSALVDSTIECYIEDENMFSHLWED
ncbi:hypothetical protein [Sebaldella sp. S0638]|uniref:hypothetical protein n=1 Tax=Sebaldella sp. S0638 TaxID=2957809 RepID=UPI0020A0D931|nr:hypothetical protein [Sebaldella sp. S0638]MCP1224812.1 hypothetical protein [Sebaldella sp. S0638]